MSVLPQPLPAAGSCALGEGPVWDFRLQRLYWVDIAAGRIHWIDSRMAERGTLPLGDSVGFVCLTDHPGVLIAGVGAGLAWVDLGVARVSLLVALESARVGLRCNDGKCDPTGRLWAGTTPRSGAPAMTGALYCVDRRLQVHRQRPEVGCSNGLAWSISRRSMYFIDSLQHRVDRHDWDPASGEIGEPETLARFSAEDGLPDGMTIDSDGHLWIAFWDGGCVRQIDGVSGAVRARIALPVTRVTSCTFGGNELSTLFITTATEGLTSAERAAQPFAGCVFQVTPGSRGLPADVFAGRESP